MIAIPTPERAAARSAAALKAWKTRRASAGACHAGSNAALKAWATRRAGAGATVGSDSTLKAWETRRRNAGAAPASSPRMFNPSRGTLAALKAVESRRRNPGVPPGRVAYLAKLRASMAGAIAGARRRQEGRKVPVAVTVTIGELRAKLAAQNFSCAITGLPFYVDDATKSFGPSRPSLDRIKVGGDYSAENLRIVLLGVNSLRGCGSDADMLRMARAIVNRAPVAS